MKIAKIAGIQARLQQDIKFFSWGDPAGKQVFVDARRYYLDTLKISLAQLREAMGKPELATADDTYAVEEIMRRVKPVSESYLRQLVKDNRITEDEMDCIIAGKYTSVDDFFDDLFNVGSPGKESDASSTGATVGDESPVTEEAVKYDNNGFLIDGNGQAETSSSVNPAATNDIDMPDATDMASGTSMIPLSPLPTRPEPFSFSWADDVEEELEALAVQQVREQQVTATATSPENVPASPRRTPSPPLSPESSIFEFIDLDGGNSDPPDTSFGATPIPEQPATPVAETTASTSRVPDTPSQPEVPVPVPEPASLVQSLTEENASKIWVWNTPEGGDEILDTWVEDKAMWFWQWEIIFAARLTAHRFKQDFRDARSVYKVDPFADEV